MATIMSKKSFISVATILFCLAAIWVGLNSNTVMPYVWHFWYGQHVSWNGIDVDLNDREYFLTMNKNGDYLFIGDLKSRDANIVLHAGRRTREFQKIYVENFCQPNECRQVNDQPYAVEGRRVDSFTFVKQHANSGMATFHQYLVIDGGNAWVEYFGTETSYPAHKSTIDALIQKIAKGSKPA